MELDRNQSGEAFRDAITSMKLIKESLHNNDGKGFMTAEECSQFANEHNLDVMYYKQSTETFYNVNHRGETLTPKTWSEMYGDILFYRDEENKIIRWHIPAFEARENARVYGTMPAMGRYPLYERNYFLPNGYRNPQTGCWNIAEPFQFFARDTGEDISYIYELLKNIAGVNYEYLLSWLRQKVLYPTRKTEVTPIIVGVEQGTGKTTFGDAICRALFGEQNVVIAASFDATNRFNSDWADKLVVVIEEKKRDNQKQSVNLLKALTTGRTVRTEQKYKDATYQESYTEMVVTTNDPIPLQFDSPKQRRFMVLEANPDFTRTPAQKNSTSELADEVFTAIYGTDAKGNKTGEPLWKNKKAVEQLKFDLIRNANLPNYKDFIETDTYKTCFSVPRSFESHTVDSIIRQIAPSIKRSLLAHDVVATPEECRIAGSMIYIKSNPAQILVNIPAIFCDDDGKDLSIPVVVNSAMTCKRWLQEEFELNISGSVKNSNFPALTGKYKNAPALRFFLDTPDRKPTAVAKKVQKDKPKITRTTTRYRKVDGGFVPSEDGEYEVINPLKEGTARSYDNVSTMKWFVFEADNTSVANRTKEFARIAAGEQDKQRIYAERLDLQKKEASRLFQKGDICRAVYTGNKSIHMLVQVAIEPKTRDERIWLQGYLSKTLSAVLAFDQSLAHPHALTRAVTPTQPCLFEDYSKVWEEDWRPIYEQWLRGKRDWFETHSRDRLLPTKAIYKEAVGAIMTGEFWTDHAWDGKRQDVFFPTYRLLRAMGWKHSDIWLTVNEHLCNYVKPEDIQYWRDRETCNLIATIDSDFD